MNMRIGRRAPNKVTNTQKRVNNPVMNKTKAYEVFALMSSQKQLT